MALTPYFKRKALHFRPVLHQGRRQAVEGRLIQVFFPMHVLHEALIC